MNAYHNLAGWLRDVRSVLGDRTELADSYYWQLRDLLEEALELVGDDEPAADELEPEDADTDVADLGPGDGCGTRPDGRRARTRSAAPLGGSPRMGDDVPRESSESGAQRTRGNAAGVARADQGVMRRGWIATGVVTKPLELNKPATPRPAPSQRTRRGSSRKAVKRASTSKKR